MQDLDNKTYFNVNAKNSDADVAALVEHFKTVIGATWATATAPNATRHVTVGPSRTRPPWTEIQRQMNSTSGEEAPNRYIRRYVAKMTPFYKWAA